jgi:hypothetical protein
MELIEASLRKEENGNLILKISFRGFASKSTIFPPMYIFHK